MSKQQTGTDPFVEKASLLGIEEEQGYDAPFANFTWEQWLEMQVTMMQRFARFQRAIEHKQAQVASQIAQEVIKLGLEWLDEATGWIGIKPE